MTTRESPSFKAVCFTIEGLNSFARVHLFNYLYFFMRDRFGFSDKDNLALAALIGLIYTVRRLAGRTIRAAAAAISPRSKSVSA